MHTGTQRYPTTPFQKPAMGIYVHIPFCPHICPYCDFVKTNRFNRKQVNAYFVGLVEQLHMFLAMPEIRPYVGKPVSLYFGGGTPGIFGAETFLPLVNLINEQFEVGEFTLESNPLTNCQWLLESWKQLGVNRLTLGAQSVCQEALKHLGRPHAPQQVFEQIEKARALGYAQVQVDLIYGLPHGLPAMPWNEQIKRLHHAGATGFSLYALTLEPGTVMARDPRSANESQAITDYETLCNLMDSYAYFQWETSNFSWFEPIHNSVYWRGAPYLGLGTGASGLLPGHRRYKVGKTQTMDEGNHDFSALTDPHTSSALFQIQWENPLSLDSQLTELVFTSLRTSQGLNFKDIHKILPKFDKNRLLGSKKISELIKQNGAYVYDNHLRLSRQEKFRGDYWTVNLLRLLDE